MSWRSAAAKLGALVAGAAALGWYYGHPLLAISAALLGIVCYWIVQMRRVHSWLAEPEQAPPEVYGIWGDILSRIHQRQQRDKATLDRLQSMVDYLQESFASMRDGVLIVDQQGVLRWFNDPAAQLLGLRREDRGQTLMNLVRAPQFLRYFNSGDYDDPLHYVSAGERRSHLSIQITRFGEGERLLFIRDVTAGVRDEQLRRDFVGNVSHELRTPLTVISGYLAALLDNKERFEPRHVKALEQMLQQAGRMESLLTDLLWLSRIEEEQSADKHELIDVGELLRELQDELGSTHPGRRVELERASEHRVRGDYRQLRSAVANLVHNALNYSPANSVVQISWRERGGSYQLAVRDSGIGIDPGHLPRLTERFYRVDDSRASSTGGTGLGLAIVKHVAAAHGARLQVESEFGKGSCFTLVFPGQGEAAAAISAVVGQ